MESLLEIGLGEPSVVEFMEGFQHLMEVPWTASDFLQFQKHHCKGDERTWPE